MAHDYRNALTLKPRWNNGYVFYEITYPKVTSAEKDEIDHLADEAGYRREDDIWFPTGDAKARLELHQRLREVGYKVVLDYDYDARPFDLQRLHLDAQTRRRLEALSDFELYSLGGWTPVQAEGHLSGCFWYFRARGSYWRFELGGNETRTRSPRWWHEEPWPSKTGFEAGYLSDEEAVRCILKAVGNYRRGDQSRFRPDHPDYERTILDGWSLGAISLRVAAIRLALTGDEVLRKVAEYKIEIPWTAERELQHLKNSRTPFRRLRSRE